MMEKIEKQAHNCEKFTISEYENSAWYKKKENESEYLQLLIVFNLYLMDVIEIDAGLTCISPRTHEMISVYFSLFFNVEDVFLQNIRSLEATLHAANTPNFHDYIALNYIE